MNCKNNLYFLLSSLIIIIIHGCKFYSFTGASIPAGTETFQVNFFENLAGNRPGSIVEPGLDQEFTIALQDLFLNQTNLSIVNKEGDLIYEGEIVEFSVTPMSATSEIKAAQNRLTMEVNVRYSNKKNEDDSFERRFSHFYDFPAEKQVYDIRDAAIEEIFERITQNIFNETLAKW
ncbi:MAG: LptE family protein [Flavobacteriaceae bacterium]|nr:LptE family protein [Flavobacteriaceae bacterium]